MASNMWKWEKLDKIREAVGLGGLLKLLAFLVLLLGAAATSEELTDSKLH